MKNPRRDGWRAALKVLQQAPPGQRFARFSEWQARRPGLWRKLLLRLIGLVLLLGGLLLLVLPGPGLLCLIAGLALLGADLPPLSAALDRGELQHVAVTYTKVTRYY